ncbi:unnamed protein product, partial [Mesorhabditis belari]|uniref:NADH dehydrogenase subunit 6 n=1 Tax=Mesorhabditis belari TaxID=2138241 RepID=A0AAF3EPL9_9BILA
MHFLSKIDPLKLRISLYAVAVLHFSGKVIWYGFGDLFFYEKLESGDMTVEGIQMNVIIYIGINILTIADLLLFLTSIILSIIGFRNGIKSLSLTHAIYMGMEVKVWYGNFEDSLIDAETIDLYLSMYLFLTSMISLIIFSVHYRQIYPLKSHSPTFGTIPPPSRRTTFIV